MARIAVILGNSLKYCLNATITGHITLYLPVWQRVRVNEVINYDLQTNPLLIKLDSTFFESPKSLNLALFTETLGHITVLKLHFKEYITLQIAHCIQNEVLTQEVSGEEQLWKVTKDGASLVIYCNHVEQIRLVFAEVRGRCEEKLSLDVRNVIFISGSKGAYWKIDSEGPFKAFFFLY